MIKAIFFDLYNTLARFHPPREEVQAEACADFEIHVTPEGITRGYGQADVFFTTENSRLPLRERSEDDREDMFAEYERIILKGAGVEVSREKAREIWRRVRQVPYDLALFDDVIPALEHLKSLDLTLGLLSNINRDGDELAQSLGLGSHIGIAITSREVGAEKPEPPIFLAALERAAVLPAEAMHVGDQRSSDVEGARAVGINPVLLDRYGNNGLEAVDCPVIRGMNEVAGLLERYRVP